MADWWEGLTERQRKFCEAYSHNGGNGAAAAREAGYLNPEVQASRLISSVKVRGALEKLRTETTSSAIMTREERQAMWSEIARDRAEQTKDRLKAAELLGKSQADFVERVHVTGEVKFKTLADQDLDAEIAALTARLGILESPR